jgi:hypothetical protein
MQCNDLLLLILRKLLKTQEGSKIPAYGLARYLNDSFGEVLSNRATSPFPRREPRVAPKRGAREQNPRSRQE